MRSVAPRAVAGPRAPFRVPSGLLAPVALGRLATLALALAGALALPAPPATAQGFGRNKVQYDSFDWKVLVTDHLEIHFYPEAEAMARRAAEYGEDACRRLDEDLGHELSRKIPVVVFGSHHHFRQNNVTPSLVGESTGGFTEIFRNRIALPYAGSEEDFRHVVNHELVHAYVFDKLYGGPIRSFFVLQYAFHIPLWFMEGIAEYYSNRWDSEAEMMLRDAAISGALPPFDRIHGGYFVYKSGWSAVGWLADRHGDDVVKRLLASMKETRDLRASVKEVTGEELPALAEKWLQDVRRSTWPAYADLGPPTDIGRMLTTHGRDGSSLNSDGVLSPDGKRVAFLSTRSGTPDLWVMDLEGDRSPRVLAHGARGGKFESLHPLRSSVGWSPEGRYLVASAQKEARDALYVLEVETGRIIAELTPDLDALERPDWSPAEARFVFTGMKDGQVDLWTVEADGSRLERLTDDLTREEAPRFSPDGRKIAYSSDAGVAGEGETDGAAAGSGTDLRVLDLVTRESRPLRVAPGDQWDPCWSADGRTVFHASDELGTRDLMALSVDDGSVRRLTALVGGAGAPSAAREGDALVFTAFHDGGWDLVLVEDADSLAAAEAAPVELWDVPWEGHTPPAEADSAEPDTARAARSTPREPYVTEYRPRFRSEWVSGAFFYDGFGASAALSAAITDVLGNHRFDVGANLFRTLENTDAIATYTYLPGRIDWSVGAFHVRDALRDDRTTLGHPIGEEGKDTLFSERRWGLLASASYPVHTFRRFGLEVTALEVEREILDEDSQAMSFRGRLLLPRIHHAFDNTLWGWTGPVQGNRWLVSLQHSVPISGDRLSYGTALVDGRHYSRFGEYVVAMRGFAAASFGEDPQQFQLGGPNTVRGHDLQSFRGRNAAVISAEFRYPFVEYVKLGWPFRAGFGGIRGDLFLDVGAAFDEPRRWRGVGRTPKGESGLEDLRVGFGIGARMRVAYLPIRIDAGWPTDFAAVGRPVWHFTIAPEF